MTKEKKQRSEAQKEAEKRYDAKREKRYKAWTFFMYPDSVPEGWQDEFASLHLKIWVSPLHDQDVWTLADEKKYGCKAGTKKKPHWHVVVEYPVQQSLSDVLEDFKYVADAIPSGRPPVRVKDLVSINRYHTHKDDPEKAQYDPKDILCFGGANMDFFEELGKGEIRKELLAMRSYIRENNVTEFDKFWDYCDDCMENWSRILDDRCYGIEKYIKARRSRIKDERKQILASMSRDSEVRVRRLEDGWACDACGEIYESRYKATYCPCVNLEEEEVNPDVQD